MPSTSPLWTVRDIRHWSNPSYTRVVIDVDGEVQYRFGRLSNPDRLYVDLLGAQLDPQLQGRSLDVSDRYLKGVRGAQNQAGVVRVVLDLKTLRDFHIFTMTDPYRLVIDIKGTEQWHGHSAPAAAALTASTGGSTRTESRPDRPSSAA